MEKKHTNPLTLADLKEALKGLATKEDLKALAPQETVSAIMETVAETKESVTELTGLMKDMLQELTATHEDVRYVRTTVSTLAQSDAAHEAAIESLRKRREQVERKVEVNWMPACSSCSRMRARKYGSPKATRAPKTASVLEASSEKNQTPGTPLKWTYVRTLSSCDWLTTGSGGRTTGRIPHMVNGVTLTQARPSKVSRLSRGAISGRRRSAATGQCRKSNLSQVWYMTGQPGGRVRIDRRSIITPSLPRRGRPWPRRNGDTSRQ
jgi:hypothetical protein